MNKIFIIGRLTADPSLETASSGREYSRFTIACDRNFKGSDGNKITDFINCVAFGKTAAFLSQYFSKGKMILVVGELNVDKYTDNEGNNRTAYAVSVSEVSFCGDSKSEGTTPTPSQNAPTVENKAIEGDFEATDDLPF